MAQLPTSRPGAKKRSPDSLKPEPSVDESNSPQYAAPALDKGLDILEILTDAEHGLSMAEIAQQLGRSMSEIFRFLPIRR